MESILWAITTIVMLASLVLSLSSFFVSRHQYERLYSIYNQVQEQRLRETQQHQEEVKRLYARLNAMRQYLTDEELAEFCERFSLSIPD